MTADRELLRGTLFNLLLNAAQAMGGKGRVTVSVTRRDDQCVIQVRDTGPGVPPEIRDQVFEPFFTTKARGGGLGLPIARRTTELHGGSLSMDCPPGGGTIMTVTLPLRASAAA
jgi:signal transduction histidine kinase